MLIQATDGVIYKNPVLQDSSKKVHYRDDLTMLVYMKGENRGLLGWKHYLKIEEVVKENSILWENKKTNGFDMVMGNCFQVVPIAPIPLKLIVTHSGKGYSLGREVYAWFWNFTGYDIEELVNNSDKSRHRLEDILDDYLHDPNGTIIYDTVKMKEKNQTFRVNVAKGKETVTKSKWRHSTGLAQKSL